MMNITTMKSVGAFAKVSALALCLVSGIAQAALVTVPTSALSNSPGVYTDGGYYTNTLGPNIVTTGGGNAANVGAANGRNDDGYMALNLGFNVTFFNHTYSSLFINNNGNVSFGSGISDYVPTGPTGATAPIISPFFGDVDTRNVNSGVVHYSLNSDDLVVTWDNVGWYDTHAGANDSFQLVLRRDGYSVPTGEGFIGFFYKNMGWSVTDTSRVAAVGFGDGLGNGEVIAGSAQSGMNTVVQNKYIWFDANLEVVPHDVPEPPVMLLVAIALFGVGMVSRKKLNI